MLSPAQERTARSRAFFLGVCDGDRISPLFRCYLFALRYPLVCEAAIEIGSFTGRQGFRASVMILLHTTIGGQFLLGDRFQN